MQPQAKPTYLSVKVGSTGYFSEFIISSSAFIKTTFAPNKKHFTVIEQAVAEAKHIEKPKGRTRITISELLNPEEALN